MKFIIITALVLAVVVIAIFVASCIITKALNITNDEEIKNQRVGLEG